MQDAVLDACILYSAPLRDFFMRLAVKLYQPKWSDTIHDEWIDNVLTNRPDLTRAQLTRTRELMNKHGGACLVAGYESLIPTLELPDQNDRHVLAAAIAAPAAIIVTFNLTDFPAAALAAHNVQVVHPDEFAMRLYSTDPDQFVQLCRLHRQSLVNPPKTVLQYLDTLAKCGLRNTVAILQAHINDI